MIGRVFRVAATLAVGAFVIVTLFWGLLNTPDSNALMLTVSAFLVVLTVIAAAVATNAAVLIARGASVRNALTAAPRGTGWFLLAFAPLLLVWFVVGRLDAWIAAHQGEINAWFIAQFGWADITRLLQAETWTSRWLRWALMPVICVSLLAAFLTSESRTRWLRRALHWRTLVVLTFAFVVLMALPWQLTAWRPTLPPTWVQPAVAAVRLGVAFVLGLFGVTVLLIAAVRDTSREARADAGSIEQ